MPTKVEKDALTGRETTGHEWDGIKELNNPLPSWWLWVFYVSIALAVVWFVLYPSIPGVNGYFGGVLGLQQREILDRQMERAAERQREFFGGIEEASLEEIQSDPLLLSFSVNGGRAAFADNCAPCHAVGGAGQAGGYPVLADDDWLWGGSLDEIYETLVVGIRHEPDDTRYSEMPAFGALGILERTDIADVSQYVLSLSGHAGDAEAEARGAVIYEEQCLACHGPDGGGDRTLGAPALNDQIWLYGGEEEQVIAQIHNPRHGVMPAWGGRLDDSTIKMLTIYVHSLGGGE